MINVEIQTYWNVETLYTVFNAVAAVMASAGFAGLLKMVFLFALGIGIFAYAGNRQMELAKWFIQALIFTTLLNLPIARVAITDKTHLEPPRVVDHVPFALAMIAQTTNLTFGFLTRSYETAFGVPDDLGLQQGDVGFGHRILKQVNNATIREPQLRADLMQFFKECTIYDIRDGVITPEHIVGGTDVWNVIFSTTNPARFVTYNTLSNPMVTDTCTNVATILKKRVEDAVVAGQVYYGKQAFTRAQSNDIAQGLFISTVATSYDWILKSSQHSSDAMKQAMFNNIWRDAGTAIPVLLNDHARVAEVSAGMAQAARQADGANSVLSLLGQETLPHMRNWIEAMLYALFPVVVVMMVVVSAEGAKKIIAGYLMSLAWIGLWPLLFAIINHLSLMHLRYKAKALELSAGVPFQLSDAFDATLSNEQAMIGYMVVLVPFIAGGIIKMGQGGFMSVADKMMTGFASSGASVGSSMASGNISMGQAGLDTAMVNTTTMQKYDSNIGLFSGGASMSRGDGSVATMAANGTVALQQLQNRMLTSMGMDQRFEASRSQDAHEASVTSRGHQLSYRQGEAATFTHSQGHARSRDAYQQTGDQIATTHQAGHSGSHSRSQGLARTLQDGSTFTTSAGAQDQLGMNIGIGRAGSAGHGAEMGSTSAKGKSSMGNTGKPLGSSPQTLAKNKHQFVSAGGGFASQKMYGAEHSRSRHHTDQHTLDEQARAEQHYSVSDSHSAQSSSGQQANQSNRDSRDSSLSQVNERSQIRDVSDRHEQGIGHRVGRSASDSFTIHKDLMADPHLFEKVAARNGMNPMRFANQSEESIMTMVQDYVAEKQIVQQAMTLPKQGLSGQTLPTTRSELEQHSAQEKATISDNIASQYRQKATQTGFSGAAALTLDTSLSDTIRMAESHVAKQLDPNHKTSIPSRATEFDETVHAWASPDKAVGEGRANPMAVVEKTEMRDAKDTWDKGIDKLMGGDGTADGERLTENMKRETGPDLLIGQPEQVKKK